MDREEMAAALAELELPDSEFEVDRLFQHLDENQDGSVQLTEWLDRLPRGTRVRIVSKYDVGLRVRGLGVVVVGFRVRRA